MASDTNEKTDLGDGIDAHFDGDKIILTTELSGITQEMALEPEVFTHLISFVAKIEPQHGKAWRFTLRMNAALLAALGAVEDIRRAQTVGIAGKRRRTGAKAYSL